MTSFLFGIIIILTIWGIATRRFFNFLPAILILSLFAFFSAMVNIFYWLLQRPVLFIGLIVLYFLSRIGKPKRKRANFYYYSNGNFRSGNSQGNPNFEDFFRQAGSGYSHSGSNGGYTRTTTFNTRSEALAILGVSEGVTKDELKRAFREKAKQHHPDKFVNASKEELELHEKEFQKINESYEYLMKDFD